MSAKNSTIADLTQGQVRLKSRRYMGRPLVMLLNHFRGPTFPFGGDFNFFYQTSAPTKCSLMSLGGCADTGAQTPTYNFFDLKPHAKFQNPFCKKSDHVRRKKRKQINVAFLLNISLSLSGHPSIATVFLAKNNHKNFQFEWFLPFLYLKGK
jgi:hypothetical protein